MAYDEMITFCGMDCDSSVYYLANENPTALAEVKKWSVIHNITIEAIKCKG